MIRLWLQKVREDARSAALAEAAEAIDARYADEYAEWGPDPEGYGDGLLSGLDVAATVVRQLDGSPDPEPHP